MTARNGRLHRLSGREFVLRPGSESARSGGRLSVLINLPVLRAGLVGLANTGTDVLLFNILLAAGILGGHAEVLLASAVTYCLGVGQSYVLSSKFVYAPGQHVRGARLAPFFLVALAGLATTTVLVWLLPPLFAPWLPSRYMSLNLARLIAIGAGFGGTYQLNRMLVFRATAFGES